MAASVEKVAVQMARVTRPVLSLALTAMAVLLGCSGPSSSARGPDAAAPAESTGQATTFDRLGYRWVVPDTWVAQEGYLDWATLSSQPHRGTPAFDTFSDPSGDPWIVVGKRPVLDDASLDQWIDQLRADQLITYKPEECVPVEDQRSTTLGGEPAEMLAFHCPVDGPKAAAVQVLSRHRDAGWVVMCYSEEGKAGPLPDLEAQCDRWLSSYEFAP